MLQREEDELGTKLLRDKACVANIRLTISQEGVYRGGRDMYVPAMPERTPNLRASYDAVHRTPCHTCRKEGSEEAFRACVVESLAYAEWFSGKVRFVEEFDIGEEGVHVNMDDEL